MSFIFWQNPPVTALFVLTAVSAAAAARVRRYAGAAQGFCVLSVTAMLLASLVCAVPYEEILLLLLVILLEFFALTKGGSA